MARPHPALFDLAAGRPLQPPSDLDALVGSAVEHRMHGLLWRRVEAGEIAGPGDWQMPLAMLSLRAEAHHQRLWKVIKALSDLLADPHFEIAHFKGVTAEARWFERMGERISGDVDLLLDPAALDRADEVLHLLSPEHPLLGQVGRLARDGHIQYLELMMDGINVDLHFDFLKLGYRARNPGRIWEEFETIRFELGGSLLVPSPELALMQRLLALNRDRFPHVLAYAEVLRIVRSGDINWSGFDELVRLEGVEEPTYEALRVVQEDLAVELPVERTGGHRMIRRIWRFAWRPSTRLLGRDARRVHKRRGFIVLPALVRGRLLDALAYWWRRLFPPREIFDYLHPEASGPYWWRFVSTRVGGLLGRKDNNRRLPS